jgi:hypothetical protein
MRHRILDTFAGNRWEPQNCGVDGFSNGCQDFMQG